MNITLINTVSMKKRSKPTIPNSFLRVSGLLLASSLMEQIPNLFRRFSIRLPIPPEISHMGNIPNLSLDIFIGPVGSHSSRMFSLIIKS